MKFIYFIMLLLFFSSVFCQDSLNPDKVSHRHAMLAGSWYPSNPDSLKNLITGYFNETDKSSVGGEIIALVVPHAGIQFSGRTAAKAYKHLRHKKYDAVIIIGPSHREAFSGSSVFNGDAYVSPLGIAKVDKELAKEISNTDSTVKLSLLGHSWKSAEMAENSIEMQIPFIQTALPGVPIVPITMGTQDNKAINSLTKAIVNAVKKLNRKVLLIASSDLSHYHDIETAKVLDRPIPISFARYDYLKLEMLFNNHTLEACGGGAIVTVMLAAEQLGANFSSPLNYSTSGNIPDGNKKSVVGYFSGALTRITESGYNMELPTLSDDEKIELIEIAKNSVQDLVLKKDTTDLPLQFIQRNLNRPFTAFVTITKKGSLRACMGHIFPSSALFFEVKEIAKMAATSDYRFGPIRKDELNDLKYEVTILSRMKRIVDTNEVVCGRDGLYIRSGNNTGLLLPQVATENSWDSKTFLENVSLKAGLLPDAYKNPEAEIYIFRAVIIN